MKAVDIHNDVDEARHNALRHDHIVERIPCVHMIVFKSELQHHFRAQLPTLSATTLQVAAHILWTVLGQKAELA